jgi:hypothetical protein
MTGANMVFVIRPSGSIRRVKRRPANWDKLESWDDYHFIPENRAWDTSECELIVKAIGLYDIHPDAADPSNDRWLKRQAREFCQTGRLNLTADPC